MDGHEPLQVLFVCSMNQWRSPTAEKIYVNHSGLIARSCGTSEKARRTARAADIEWADIIMVMESKHQARLQHAYPAEMRDKIVYVLSIPDEYQFMDPALIEEIRAVVDPILEAKQN